MAILGPGDFWGEGAMAGQSVRMGTATATMPTALLVIQTNEMIRVLHTEHAFSDRFVSYMLSRNIRIEADKNPSARKNGGSVWGTGTPQKSRSVDPA